MKFQLAIAAYVICGVLAFGHSASNTDCTGLDADRCSEKSAFSGLMAAMFSPLYWSWVAMEREK